MLPVMQQGTLCQVTEVSARNAQDSLQAAQCVRLVGHDAADA